MRIEALEVELVGAVHDSVEDGVGHSGVANVAMPGMQGELAAMMVDLAP